jgi:hypothetical protein
MVPRAHSLPLSLCLRHRRLTAARHGGQHGDGRGLAQPQRVRHDSPRRRRARACKSLPVPSCRSANLSVPFPFVTAPASCRARARGLGGSGGASVDLGRGGSRTLGPGRNCSQLSGLLPGSDFRHPLAIQPKPKLFLRMASLMLVTLCILAVTHGPTSPSHRPSNAEAPPFLTFGSYPEI